jgi:hypothetical protein
MTLAEMIQLTRTRSRLNSHHPDNQSSLDDLEQDYWNAVESQTENIEVWKLHSMRRFGTLRTVQVEYANDLDTTAFWSGFPVPVRVCCAADRAELKCNALYRRMYHDWVALAEMWERQSITKHPAGTPTIFRIGQGRFSGT